MRRIAVTVATLSLGAVHPPLWGQTSTDQRAQSAADQVLKSYGTGEQLNANGMQPLSSDKPMQTVDGTQLFGAKTACQASARFMRVTILPNATSDIQTLTVDLDPTFTGAVTNSSVFTGPFAAVCNNGVVQCDADSFNNCHYQQWHAQSATGNVGLTEVGPEALGACYCFNNSCGNNLLWVNSGKVLNDLGAGIALELNKLYPRLSIGRSDLLDAVTLVYYGQNAACGTDSSPEQYYTHAQDLAAAGVAAGNQPGSVANFIASTPASAATSMQSVQCQINRSVGLDEVTRDGIISLLSATRGGWDTGSPSCSSTDCLDFSVGDNQYHEYAATSACQLFTETALLNIARPDRIVSATLVRAQYDDHGQVWAGDTREFTTDGAWTTNGPFPAPSCETGTDHYYSLNTDLTSAFTSVATHSLKLTVNSAVGGLGDGGAYFEVRVRPGCEVLPDEVTDGCTAHENNAQCGVWEEWVDGVQTVKDGLTTGLSPLPSAHTLTGNTCSVSTGNRNWWSTRRIYQCVNGSSTYDFSDVVKRRESVTGSLNTTSGNYTDRVTNPDGTVTNPNGTVSLPPPQATSCQQTCKTRTARPGDTVGLSGPQSALNSTGVSWTFHYKNCTAASVCPVDPGEEVVSACDCQSNFAQAAAMMQTIRMVKEDQTCSP
jgi:hypothetical protein